MSDKSKAVDNAMAMIEKKFGKGSIMRMSDKTVENIASIPTGSFNLDNAIGVGGLPRGRIIEIYGPESSGKTTLTLHCIAQAQKQGLTCAFIDAEHALDPVYAENLGVDLDSLIMSQPDNGEQALEIVETLTSSQGVDFIVVDSVAALTPKAEIEGDMGDSHMGLQARLMSQGLRKITGLVKKNEVTIVFINQLRMKIGVMFGNPETTTGGNALKFYASVRIDVRKKTAIKDGEVVVGNETLFKVVKNKVAPPFRTAETCIMYGKGIDRFREIVTSAVKEGVVNKAGAWYSYKGEKIGQGLSNSISFLEENLDIYKSIEKEIIEKTTVISKKEKKEKKESKK